MTRRYGRPGPRKLRNLTKSTDGLWRFQAMNSDKKRVRPSLSTSDQEGSERVTLVVVATVLTLVAHEVRGQEAADRPSPAPAEESGAAPAEQEKPEGGEWNFAPFPGFWKLTPEEREEFARRSGEVPDRPNRQDILNPDGTSRDLSKMTREERQRIVREFSADSKEALKRYTRRKLMRGRISQDEHDALLAVPGARYCWFRGATPNGFTEERLTELQAEFVGRTTTEFWYRIMAEPPVGDEPGINIQIASPDGPNCTKPIDEWD